MSFQVAEQIGHVRAIAYAYWDDWWDEYLSPAELEEARLADEEAPPDDDPAQYAYAVWDAVNKRWVDV